VDANDHWTYHHPVDGYDKAESPQEEIFSARLSCWGCFGMGFL
jgi:hypothetical protein